jgi:hypothetical protein
MVLSTVCAKPLVITMGSGQAEDCGGKKGKNDKKLKKEIRERADHREFDSDRL